MSEATSQAVVKPVNPDRYKALVVVLTVLTTVVTAIVAGLQADANIRANTSNRDSQAYAVEATGELHHQDLQTGYDTSIFSSYLKDAEEATILQMTALEQEQKGDTAAATDSLVRSAAAQARADAATKFSVFFTDSRYAPKSSGGLPDMQAYMTDSFAAANALVAKQNAAADQYNRWNRKGDSYTSILAVLAIAFFLFGLAQALTPRLRLLFAIFGLVALMLSSIWMLIVLVS